MKYVTMAICCFLLAGCGLGGGKKGSSGGGDGPESTSVDVEGGSTSMDLGLVKDQKNTLDKQGLVSALEELNEALVAYYQKVPTPCLDALDTQAIMTSPQRGLLGASDARTFSDDPEDATTVPEAFEGIEVFAHVEAGPQFSFSYGMKTHLELEATTVDGSSVHKLGGNDQFLYWLEEGASTIDQGEAGGWTSELYVFDRKAKTLTGKKHNVYGIATESDGQCPVAGGCEASEATTIDLGKGQIQFAYQFKGVDTDEGKIQHDYASDFRREGDKVVGTYEVKQDDYLTPYFGEPTAGKTPYEFQVDDLGYMTCTRPAKS